MANTLKYNVDVLNEQSRQLANLASDISTACTNMNKNVNQLKTEWVGPGADAFFNKLGNDWQPAIESYVAMLKELSGELSRAADRYEELDSQYGQMQVP